METIHLTTTIADDGRLHIDAPCRLPPGPAEVVVVVHPATAVGASIAQRVEAFRRLGALDLPVADVATMNRGATPGPDVLLS
jgi:hypothetical protein